MQVQVQVQAQKRKIKENKETLCIWRINGRDVILEEERDDYGEIILDSNQQEK